MDNWTIILSMFFAVLATGIITYVFQDKFKGVKHYITTVGVAFVLSLICVHILPEIFHSHVPNIGAYLLLGFIFQIFLELFSKGIEHGHVHANEHGVHYSLNRTLLSMFFGLCVHSLIEGIPLFLLESPVEHVGHTHSIVHESGGFSKVFFLASRISSPLRQLSLGVVKRHRKRSAKPASWRAASDYQSKRSTVI